MSKSWSTNKKRQVQQSTEQNSQNASQPSKSDILIFGDQQESRTENTKDSTNVKAFIPSQVQSSYLSNDGGSSFIPDENQHVSQIQQGVMSSGLPNIGNTCYLNSVIQFLFGATTYRQEIIKSTSDQKVIKALGKIFRFMKQEQEDLKISVYLAELRRTLDIGSMIPDDAFRVLNLLLEKSEKLRNLFRSQYVQSCRCNYSGQLIMSSSYLMVETERCGRCDNQLCKKFEIMPQYLMFVGQVKSPSKEILINGQRYDFVGQILYSGNGLYGHYVCERLIKGKRYIFDDQTSVIGMQFYRQGFQSKVLLYKHRRSNEIQRPPYRCYEDCKIKSDESLIMNNNELTIFENTKEISKVFWDCLSAYGRVFCLPLFCIWGLMQKEQTIRRFRRTTAYITMKSFYSDSEDVQISQTYLPPSFILECLL